jgi:predicted permease
VKLPYRRKTQQQAELNEELHSHLQMATRDRLERGESAQNAQQAARREFGNVALIEQVTRDQWGTRWLEELLQDLRYAARMLRKNPGFTLIAVLTLALGIGANTALFSVVNGVLLNPLPYPHPEQLVTLHESKPNFDRGSISYPNFRDWQKNNRTFASMAIARGYGYSLTGLGDAEQVRARFISSDFFPLLGVNPVLGRNFSPGEDEIGAAPIAMISAGLWKRKFASSPAALGKALTLDGKDYTIVGVTPQNFDLFLTNSNLADVFVPIGQWSNPLLPNRGAGLGIHGVGRLKPGISLEQARADMDRVTSNLAAAYPEADKGIGASFVPIRQDMLGDVQPILLVLLGAVAFVLLIACVNVANLLLARSTARMREFAIRAALGAGKRRLIAQILTESVLLALAGGGLGLLLAHWGTQAALSALPAELPRAAEIQLDSHVLFFTLAITLLAGILFGLAPALKTAHLRLNDTLKESGRGTSGTRLRTQSVFVVVEMALALVLLAGAGLMVRTVVRLWNVNPGFEPKNVLTFSVAFPPAMTTATLDATRAAVREIDEKLSSIPGMQAVAQTWEGIPLIRDDEQLFWLDTQPKPSNTNEMNWAIHYVVGPGYLDTMGIPLLRGRFFNAQDRERSPLVVVIDDVFARKFFGNQNPVGKGIVLNSTGKRAEIVGVVGHVNQWGLDSDATQSLRAQLYVPCMQMPDDYIAGVRNGLNMVVRSNLPVPALLDSMRRVSQQMSKDQVIFGAQTMDQIISDSLAARRFSMILFGAFAALALALASVGIYGVISYLVSQRTQEIGIRLALGAGRADILRLVLTQGTKMAGLGVLIGLAASLLLTRLMAKMLYGVSPSDPLTFFAVAAILTLVALAASYIPARRAMRVDPIVALRYE